LEGAGLDFKAEDELESFGAAAAGVLKTARDVPYGSLKLEYMQSFALKAQ
jgi:hypothetical protein